jgi:two-component system nitrate/nitrite response regulator NarL
MVASPDPIRILLVDDDQTVLWGLTKLIESETPRLALAGKASSCDDALTLADERPDVILLDLALRGESGIEIIPELIRRSDARVLVHTGIRNRRLYEDTLLFGAMGIVQKGKSGEDLLCAIAHVYRGGFWNAPAPANTPNEEPGRGQAFGQPRIGSVALTVSERQLFAYLAAGWPLGHGYAAAIRQSSPRIEEVLSLYEKLGLRNRAELFLLAVHYGLTDILPEPPMGSRTNVPRKKGAFADVWLDEEK